MGSLIVNRILDHYIVIHLPREQAYPLILQIMAGFLVIGFFANLLVRPVAERFWMKEQPNTAMQAAVERSERENGMNRGTKDTSQHKTPPTLIAAAWIVVSIPLAWGVYNTALNAGNYSHIRRT